jgi:hypothetical protein
MINICICGGGNLGHVIGGYLAAKPDINVSILTRHPERWGIQLEITLPNGSSTKGDLDIVTNAPSKVIPNTDIAFICLPGMYIRKEIEEIKPYLSPKTVVGTVVSSTGFFFQAHELIPNQPTFGFQRVPYIARTDEYGHKANLLGFRKELFVVIENAADTESLRSTLEDILDTPVRLLENFYEVALTNSNPLLHTSRLYTQWKDWHEGVFYPRQTLFYEEWTPETAQLYIDMDNEFQQLLQILGVRKGAIPPVLDYYESHDAESLCHKIQIIPAFKGLKSPMIETPQGWIPDSHSRYFTEDFGYGLKYIYQLAQQHHLSTPNINKVYDWGKKFKQSC